MKPTITLVHAPELRYDQNYGTLFSPLWAYTLAAHIPESWDVSIADCMVEDPNSIPPADIFAFSGINQDIESIREVHGLLKDKYPGSTFILGGPITWSLEQEGKLSILDFFDRLFILDGEETLPAFLRKFAADDLADVAKVIRAERFPLGQARPIRFDLYARKSPNYYGALIEVSRGCPFLCEFCDIRVLPGNNRPHNKDVGLIIDELDGYFRLGVTQFQFACDNFIGDLVWARECVDAIIDWKSRTGAKISIFTWLTINLYKLPDLMAKMRRAGFSILFIGIESVNRNSLLETAKVQNTKSLLPAVQEIQAYGFIIAPGFIFGFDSDRETVFDDTLQFFLDSGLIGGDPSFLMALPGTPLFERVKRTGRLIERDESVTTREKIITNMRYLQDPEFLARGFIGFLKRYTSARFQLARFKKHLDAISASEDFLANEGVGYGSAREYLKLQIKDPVNRRFMFLRIGYILHNPATFIAVLRAWLMMKRLSRGIPGLAIHFNYWVYVWTNIGLKYWRLKESDIALHGVAANFDINSLIDTATTEATRLDADGPKIEQQARLTNQALKQVVEDRLNREATAQGGP